MQRVSSVAALPGYRLDIRFEDGTCGVVPLQDRLFGSMFAPLQDVALFNQVEIDEFGVICWPNGADLAPDALYTRLQSVPAAT